MIFGRVYLHPVLFFERSAGDQQAEQQAEISRPGSRQRSAGPAAGRDQQARQQARQQAEISRPGRPNICS